MGVEIVHHVPGKGVQNAQIPRIRAHHQLLAVAHEAASGEAGIVLEGSHVPEPAVDKVFVEFSVKVLVVSWVGLGLHLEDAAGHVGSRVLNRVSF